MSSDRRYSTSVSTSNQEIVSGTAQDLLASATAVAGLCQRDQLLQDLDFLAAVPAAGAHQHLDTHQFLEGEDLVGQLLVPLKVVTSEEGRWKEGGEAACLGEDPGRVPARS